MNAPKGWAGGSLCGCWKKAGCPFPVSIPFSWMVLNEKRGEVAFIIKASHCDFGEVSVINSECSIRCSVNMDIYLCLEIYFSLFFYRCLILKTANS